MGPDLPATESARVCGGAEQGGVEKQVQCRRLRLQVWPRLISMIATLESGRFTFRDVLFLATHCAARHARFALSGLSVARIRGQSIRGNTRRRIFLVAEPDSRATAARISGSGRSKAKLRMPKPLGA